MVYRVVGKENNKSEKTERKRKIESSKFKVVPTCAKPELWRLRLQLYDIMIKSKTAKKLI